MTAATQPPASAAPRRVCARGPAPGRGPGRGCARRRAAPRQVESRLPRRPGPGPASPRRSHCSKGQRRRRRPGEGRARAGGSRGCPPSPARRGTGAAGPAHAPVAAGKRARSGCGGRRRRLGLCGRGGSEMGRPAPRRPGPTQAAVCRRLRFRTPEKRPLPSPTASAAFRVGRGPTPKRGGRPLLQPPKVMTFSGCALSPAPHPTALGRDGRSGCQGACLGVARACAPWWGWRPWGALPSPRREGGSVRGRVCTELRGGCVRQCTRSQGIKEMRCDPTGCLEDVSVGARGHGGSHALT